MLGTDRRALDANRLDLRIPANARGHLKATFSVTVTDATHSRDELQLSVEGVGLGYFGTHAAAVAEPLREFLPPVLGVRDGLLLRAWMPEDARANLLPTEAQGKLASRVAEYVFARGQRLTLDEDVTLRQSGQYPAWEAASRVVEQRVRPRVAARPRAA